MLQYKIPQNVGIEDKIVGPFSLRQLIIIAIGAGVSYVLFVVTSRIYELNILEYIFLALPALFSLALAMLKIHNVSFGKYILLMLEFAIKPKKRMWDHRGISALVAPDLTGKKTDGKKKEQTPKKARGNVNLSDLSATLDSGGFEHVEQISHEDIDEVTDDDLITEAYFGNKQKTKSDNMYWRTRDMQKKKLELLAKMTPAERTKAKKAEAAIKEASPQKKESVVQHLAEVIKEARQNNQTTKNNQPATPPPAAVEPVISSTPPAEKKATPSSPSETFAAPPPKKKKRRRKRKPKKTGQEPVRPDTQVNTTQKSDPDKLIRKSDTKEAETSFDDLSGGGEIEFNLD